MYIIAVVIRSVSYSTRLSSIKRVIYPINLVVMSVRRYMVRVRLKHGLQGPKFAL
jgi:hypothetical protein